MPKKNFDIYANYYDELYKDKNYKKETNFVIKNLKKNKKKIKTILEIGCGTGNHAIFLAKSGFSVVGIDSSKKMIEVANKKKNNLNIFLKKKLIFKNINALEFKTKKKFDAVIMLFHVFNFLNSKKKITKFVNKIFNTIKFSGILLFDFINADCAIKNKPKITEKEIKTKLYFLKRSTKPILNLKKRNLKIIFKIFVNFYFIKKQIKFLETHNLSIFSKNQYVNFFNNRFKLLRIGPWLNMSSNLTNNHWNGYAVLKKENKI